MVDRVRSVARGSVLVCGAAALLGSGLAGCDRLPWTSGGEQDEVTAGVTATPSPPVPGSPLVAPGDVVATVNRANISNADVELRLQELRNIVEVRGEQWTPPTSEQLEGILEELIDTELINQDAAARGLDRSLEVQQRWEYIRRGFYAQEWLRWNQQRLEVAPGEVEAYYEANKLGFREFERIQLRQLVVSSEDQAKQALTQLHSGTVAFEALARQISGGPTAAEGGLLAAQVMRASEKAIDFVSEEQAQAAGVISLDPVLEAAAFAIAEKDQLSSYVKGPDGRYHIFQLVERQEGRQRPISELWDDIQTFLLAQKLQEAVDELNRKAVIERFTDRIGALAP
jgi:hypothetical protein